jgi:hypothetical protein
MFAHDLCKTKFLPHEAKSETRKMKFEMMKCSFLVCSKYFFVGVAVWALKGKIILISHKSRAKAQIKGEPQKCSWQHNEI